MSRRDFLRMLPSVGAAGLLSCASGAAPQAVSAAPGPRRKLRAICFDLFTLFDPRSVVEVAKSAVGEQATELCDAWRVRQFEYSWQRVAAEQYVDFGVVTEQALLFAAKQRRLTLDDATRRRLLDAYCRLTPWPDTRASLLAWKRAGLRLAPLSNYSPAMLSQLLANAGLSELFDAQISTDPARSFKPAPRAYALGETTLG
ncbi:MAG TPA: haloacid dehalogenase type II, partial [Polyangiaceae bacterium]|nr:haloacid dehalogenase type II [Polyangiaceae bacterium]